MATPKALTGSPLAIQPPGLTAAGNKLGPLFYEKDVNTGLPINRLYDEAGNSLVTPRTITASTTATASDNASIVSGNHATVAIALTIPPQSSVAWPEGASLHLYMMGAAACTFAAGAGVTIRDPGTLNAGALSQYQIRKATRVASDAWTIS